MYFKAHACLAAYTNIRRRNLSITIQTVRYNVKAIGPMNEEAAY